MNAQSEKVETVYFDFDKYGLDSEQQQTILDFIAKADTSKIESVQIYGCDDRGNADYNYKLSEERVSTVRNLLTANGLKKKQNLLLKERTRNFN
jgi:outer membrane protein OmpA-like peptidoglycan-associated protein